jgi:hypothetical protein
MALTALCGCTLLGGSLEQRAAGYYNYMAGKQPQVKYSSFISPAYRQAMGSSTVKQLDESKGLGRQPNERYPDATAEHVSVSIKDQFAYTMVDPGLGDAFRAMPPVKWVKVGRRWYLYMGSDAEAGKYGPFPPDLSPREPPGSDPAS